MRLFIEAFNHLFHVRFVFVNSIETFFYHQKGADRKVLTNLKKEFPILFFFVSPSAIHQAVTQVSLAILY